MKKAKKIRNYSDYTLEHLRNLCGIDNHYTRLSLLKNAINPSEWLLTTIRFNQITVSHYLWCRDGEIVTKFLNMMLKLLQI